MTNTQESIFLRLCTACCSLHDAADGGGVRHAVHADVEVSAVAGVLAVPAVPAAAPAGPAVPPVRGHVLAAGVVLPEEHLIAHGARVAHLAVRVLLPGVRTSYFCIRGKSNFPEHMFTGCLPPRPGPEMLPGGGHPGALLGLAPPHPAPQLPQPRVLGDETLRAGGGGARPGHGVTRLFIVLVR